MAYDVRPLSFAEILDRAFRVLRDHFTVLVAISAVTWLPYGALEAIGETMRSTGATVGALLLMMLLSPVTIAALTTAVADIYLGKSATIGGSYRTVRPLLFAIIGTYVLFYLLLVLAFIALVIPGIFFSVAWSLVGPAMIVERRFGRSALRRSRELVKGAWWRTGGIATVATLIVGIPQAILGVFWSFIPIVGPLMNGLTQSVVAAYSAIVIVLYYFDRRCRTEEFDLRLLAEQVRADGNPGLGSLPASAPIA